MKAGRHIKATEISDFPSKTHPFPCYGGNGIRGYVSEYSHDGAYVIIGRQGALCGNVKRTKGKFYATEHAVVTEALDDLNIDWTYHMLEIMNLNQYASKSAQPVLQLTILRHLKFLYRLLNGNPI